MKKVTIPFLEAGIDHTRVIREIIETGDNNVVYQFSNGEDTPILAEGLLPEEEALLGELWVTGRYGIFRIQGKEKIIFREAAFYVKQPATMKEYATREEMIGVDMKRTDRSERSFLRVLDSKDIVVEDLIFRSNNDTPFRKEGEPDFSPAWESEHFVNIAESDGVLIKNCKAEYVWGDGFTITGLNTKNITIQDMVVNWNGRQGGSITGGSNILIDNVKIVNSTRGGFDIESNFKGGLSSNIIIRNSYAKCRLHPFPMGGYGIIDGVLIENNEYDSSLAITAVLGNRSNNTIRRNIIFRGNKRLNKISSSGPSYDIVEAENILIEKEYDNLEPMMSQMVARITDSKNVVIRNNNFENGRYILLRSTQVSEVKVYGNKQELFFLDGDNLKPASEIEIGKTYYVAERNDTDFHALGLPTGWDGGREFTATKIPTKEELGDEIGYVYDVLPIEEYDVEKYGEPDVPKDPDFIPYMGVDTVEPEPTEPDPTPEPEEPQEPETPEPPVEQPEKSKEWYENKLLWVIGGIVLVLILALAL